MKMLRAVSILILVFGLFCILVGLYQLITLQSTVQIWEQLQQAGSAIAQSISPSKLRARIVRDAFWFLVIGLLSTFCGVGLAFVKDWARKLWLGVLVLLAAINLYSLADYYLRGVLRGADVFGFLVIGAVLCAMWFYFRRSKTRSLFRGSAV